VRPIAGEEWGCRPRRQDQAAGRSGAEGKFMDSGNQDQALKCPDRLQVYLNKCKQWVNKRKKIRKKDKALIQYLGCGSNQDTTLNNL
jgi:hypothetical protein